MNCGMRNVECGMVRTRAILLTGLFGVTRAFAQMVPVAPNADGTPTPPPIRDIAPPVDAFPYPAWLVALCAAAALVVIALIVWMLVRLFRNAAPLPPTPREVALASLREAQKKLDALDPHAFSILVSDILRSYISAHYGLHATEQTSAEFLASVADSPRFTREDKTLLASFLEKCDLIKFARVDATRDDSATLLDQALRFVERSSPMSNETREQTGLAAGSPISQAGGNAAR
jgi:hypothetical protein